MPRICYQVAATLDGFIAGPHGEHDWIPHDPDVDFEALFARFDTFLMGRRTYEALPADQDMSGWGRVYVVSRTLSPEEHPRVTIVSEPTREILDGIRSAAARDIWLFGGGALFHTLLEMGQVDTVEVAVVPVLLGDGIPLLPPPMNPTVLRLTDHTLYPASGIMSLEYEVVRESGRQRSIR
jgi:dihydrofolate reductase